MRYWNQRFIAPIGVGTRRRSTAHVYELTPWGYDAEPWMNAMGRWASRSPLHDGAHFSLVSLALSMRTNFDPDKAKGFAARIALHVCGEELAAEVGHGAVTVARDDGRDAAATFPGRRSPSRASSTVASRSMR